MPRRRWPAAANWPTAALATSRTRATTSSSGSSVAGFTFGSSELRSQDAGATLPLAASGTKSQVTKETSASGSAAGVSSALATPSVRSFCGLNGGILADSSETRQRKIAGRRARRDACARASRSRTRVLVGTRSDLARDTRLAERGKPVSLVRRRSDRSPTPPSAPRNAVSTRSGAAAKLVSPSREAKTAPPIRAAPHRPVRIVPLNHCTETRRRSDQRRRCRRRPKAAARCRDRWARLRASDLRRAPCAWSKTPFPRTRDRVSCAAYAAPSLVRSPERIPKASGSGPAWIEASNQGDRRRHANPGRINATGSPRLKALADAAAPPHCDIPDTIV